MTNTISKKLGLICISLSAFFYGCQDKDDVAADLISNGTNEAHRVEIYDIDTKVVLDPDSIDTIDDLVFLVGEYTDANFGQVYSEAYITFSYNDDDFTTPSDAVVDSVKLNFVQNADYSFGTLNSLHNYEVYELTEGFDQSAEDFWNTTKLNFSNENIASGNAFYPVPVSDSLVSLNLTSSFGSKILSYSPDNISDYNGIALLASDGNTSIQGFDRYDAQDAQLTVYYHTGTETELSVDLSIEHTASYLSVDRTGSDLASLSNSGDQIDSDDLGNNIFIQSAAGIRTLVSFPTLHLILDTLDDQFISRAYLEVYVDTEVSSSTSYPFDLRLYTAESGYIAHSYVEEVQISNFSSGITYEAYNSEEGVYRLPLTYFVSNLLSTGEEAGIYSIVPSADSYYLSNMIGYDAHSSNGDKRMRLVVYYYNTGL